jgi:SEC-C motif-containing protein
VTDKQACPCGSGQQYEDCCGRFIDAGDLPRRAEQLMRSRYTAFFRGNSDYLLETWHSSTCPEQLRLEPGVTWFGLQILDCQAGEAEDPEGWVEFVAKFNGRDRLQCLHERSRFAKQEDRWFYVDGVIAEQDKAEKIGRNDPCPCGSGKKFKRCCG